MASGHKKRLKNPEAAREIRTHDTARETARGTVREKAHTIA
jgi:hypothetical protein